MVEEAVDSGGSPDGIGKCLECGKVYPVRRTDAGELRPIGTSGTCKCGHARFETYSRPERP